MSETTPVWLGALSHDLYSRLQWAQLVTGFYDELKSFSRRDLRIFKTREEALAWLAGDSAEA